MGINDLELDTQLQMFNKRVLKVDPAVLDLAGYHCIRNFFETINLAERKIKRVQSSQQLVNNFIHITLIEFVSLDLNLFTLRLLILYILHFILSL